MLFAALLAVPSSSATDTQDLTPWMIVTREKLEVNAPSWQWSGLVSRNGGTGIFSESKHRRPEAWD